MRLLLGDCLDKLKELDDNSIDSIVTDPPYGLSFMGKKWDYDVPSQDIWEECMRVLKPGGHLLAFAGSRTYHRMAIRIEDAGFEIRDQIMWIYGNGFPKSLNIGKGIDKQGGNSLGNEVAELVKKKRLEMGLSTIQLAELGKFYGKTNHGGTVSNWETGRGSITPEQFNKLIEILNLENNPIVENKREVLGTRRAHIDLYQNIGGGASTLGDIEITKGNSEWEGWGTALKPAHEPIVMARKPFKGTVVDNVLEWGTGGINIDDSRIEGIKPQVTRSSSLFQSKHDGRLSDDSSVGRFPANVIFDEEAGKILDEQSGASRFFYCPKTSKTDRNEGLDNFEEKQTTGGGGGIGDYIDNVNSASGKFGSEKAPSKNNHPTVKPTDLMLYLIRLITPKGGTTLDPFMGSGSTGKAAVRGGFDFVGIEREQEYKNIAEARIQYEIDNPYNEEKGERVEINKNHEKFW